MTEEIEEEKNPEIESLVVEEDFKEKYLRVLAESENIRKRLQKDKLEAVLYAEAELLADILQPIDNMENALRFAKDAAPEVRNWALGFEMILGQLKEVLINHGVSPIDSIGKEFDPYLHEAVETLEIEEIAPGTILEEFSRGYRIGTKVLRPARVKVAQEIKNNI
ncbi:MAG: nucleotide exchange factor GrpE [Chlamydiae bacterium]|nr:nucleotide exchange factor GrpE [Chlamydiota bacterium]